MTLFNHLKRTVYFLPLIAITCACSSNKVVGLAKKSNTEKTTISNKVVEKDGIKSIDTKYTITKTRIAKNNDQNHIIGSSFEGRVVAIDYNGQTLWTNPLSGFMNHDIWCEDITGDGNDEVLAANADGHVYCLSNQGKLLWKFKANEAPMYSVCAVKKDGVAYVVSGSYDKNLYYLSPKGALVKSLASSTYNTRKKRGKGKNRTTQEHLVNILRKMKAADGSEHLVMHITSNSMQDKGEVLFFEPLAEKPYKKVTLKNKKPIGDLRVTDYFGNGAEEILAGTSNHISKSSICKYNVSTETNVAYEIGKRRAEFGGFAYLVSQIELIPNGDSYQYFALVGPSIALINPEFNLNESEIIGGKYAFNDMWQDKENKKIILGSVQSGGSSVHIIDYTNKDWKKGYQNLAPQGKIQTILDNTEQAKKELFAFKAPSWERQPKPVYFVSDLNANKKKEPSKDIITKLHTKYDSPIFLGYTNSNKEDPATWNRDTMSNEFYRTRRDKRMKYIATQSEILKKLTPVYDNYKGLAMWGGHGNDPYFYSMDTRKRLLDAANGKKTVLIFPELENDTEDFKYVLDNMLYPLAEYGSTRNLNIHLRCKHTFWQGAAHRPLWSRLASGEFADVFVPSMEETTDKSMELSVAGRMGFWMSGAVNQWGTRVVPDNVTFDRLRQFGSQRLPNHFLRQTIYNIANGATHLNNLSMDKEYMSLVWELVAKGALYVPNRVELLSISPVHLSMTTPDHDYLEEGADVKIVTHYDKQKEANNKMVFSRLNGSWPGAPLTDWDFSNYAANETERRLNFIPAYNNGMVLITPVQDGALANDHTYRGKLIDHLHPLYKNILQEYITDGRNYISSDGKQTFPADTYYKTVKADIENKAKLLPITVSGDAGWVVAQTDDLHLRLTLVDGGYINPSEKEVTVTFHTAKPIKMTDVLSSESFDLSNPKAVKVTIPCGLYRFIDVELKEKLSLK